MTMFLFVAALMTTAALAFVLPPLLRKEKMADADAGRDRLNLTVLRDQLRELDADLSAGLIDKPAYEAARRELERRVAEDVRPDAGQDILRSSARDSRWPVAVLGLGVPAIAAALYFMLGTPGAFDPAKADAADGAHAVTQEQVEAMVSRLAARLQGKPDDAEGWHMLARSYAALGRYDDSVKAYAHLTSRVPPNGDLLADYADTLAMALGKTLQGEPEKIVERALQADPNHLKALSLYGSAAFERRDYAGAIARWEKILALVPADSDIARSIQGSIGEARQKAGLAASAPVSTAASAASATSAARLQGSVDIDPALRAHADPNDTVFIFARAADGPRFPLAIVRKQVKDLPASFTLDDSMSMVPDTKLSSFARVVVSARISKSGSATPAAGDLEGLTGAVAPGTANLKVVINTRRQ